MYLLEKRNSSNVCASSDHIPLNDDSVNNKGMLVLTQNNGEEHTFGYWKK